MKMLDGRIDKESWQQGKKKKKKKKTVTYKNFQFSDDWSLAT